MIRLFTHLAEFWSLLIKNTNVVIKTFTTKNKENLHSKNSRWSSLVGLDKGQLPYKSEIDKRI